MLACFDNFCKSDPSDGITPVDVEAERVLKFRFVFWDVLPYKIIATHTSETSVDNYFTQQYIPEDISELHTHRRENLKSHEIVLVSQNRCHIQKFCVTFEVFVFKMLINCTKVCEVCLMS
jgi:hypothetical protein